MGAPISPAVLARLLNDAAAAGFSPDRRGYAVHYRGSSTACPCCSRSNWLVGRQLAECAFCAAAVPIARAGE